MKVLYLAPPLENGARTLAYTVLEEEAHALRTAGVDVYVLATAGEDHDEGGLRVRVLPPGRGIYERMETPPFVIRHRRALPRHMSVKEWAHAYHFARIERFVAKLLRDEHIDVIHSHFAWPGGFGGAIAAAETGRPLIASFRGMDLNTHAGLEYGMRRDPFTAHVIQHLVRSANRTTYVSDFMRAIGLTLGANPAKAITVRKGVDLARFAPTAERIALRAELGIHSPMLLSVGGLQKLKGIDHVLEALAPLRPTNDFRYVVVGEGGELENLEAASQRLGLTDRVEFRGRVDRANVPAYFAACDCLILGSLTEASGNVLLESMSSGRPVICTDSGGPAEYVQHGVTGFVVPVGDSHSMTERVRQLLHDPDLADSLGRAARIRMVEGFGYRRMIDEIISLYEDVQRDTPRVRRAAMADDSMTPWMQTEPPR